MLDYEYLIHLIYAAVSGLQPKEKPEEVSFDTVYALGKTHEVGNIAFLSVEKLHRKPEETLYNEWKLFYYFSVQRDARQTAAYEETVAALHGAGIRTLEAQGTVTKQLYPKPELRMMSDIDFIIDVGSLAPAMETMRALGYEVKQDIPLEFNALKEQMLIEFHTDFFTEYMYNRKERFAAALHEPFLHADADAENPLRFVLKDDYFYLYSVLHIIKHFETAGCGIRRILDLYYLKKHFAGRLDGELVASVLDNYGFRESYETLFAIEGEWFENVPSKRDLSEAVADVISGGNHGTDELFTRNNLRKDRAEGAHLVKLKALMDFLFPQKEYIYLEFPVCRERGYSLFRCRMYRIVIKLKAFQFGHAIDYIKTVLKSD